MVQDGSPAKPISNSRANCRISAVFKHSGHHTGSTVRIATQARNLLGMARRLLIRRGKDFSMRQLIVPILLILPVSATAQAIEDFDAIDRRIAIALGGAESDAGLLAQPIDRRLKLAACPSPATIDPPALGAVAVRCAPLGWRIRVPLKGGGQSSGELLVRKGDTVELAYAGSGFAIVTSALAQEDGRLGQAVRVKSPTGAALVTAQVRGVGRVSIDD
jgi:flagellar basal body P-ring formation protein FlgA